MVLCRLHAVRLLCIIIIQLHHGLLWSDHAGRGGLASTRHDAGRSWIFPGAQLPSLRAWPRILQRRLLQKFPGCRTSVNRQSKQNADTGPGSFYVGGGSEHRTVSGIGLGSQGRVRTILPWGKISGWREKRAVGGEGLLEMELL